MSTRFKITADWMRFFLTIAFFCILHFGDGRYVSKADYSAEMKTIAAAIVAMDKQIALLESGRSAIVDHESRIRALEQKTKLSYEIKKTPLGSLEPFLTGSLYAAGDR